MPERRVENKLFFGEQVGAAGYDINHEVKITDYQKKNNIDRKTARELVNLDKGIEMLLDALEDEDDPVKREKLEAELQYFQNQRESILPTQQGSQEPERLPLPVVAISPKRTREDTEEEEDYTGGGKSGERVLLKDKDGNYIESDEFEGKPLDKDFKITGEYGESRGEGQHGGVDYVPKVKLKDGEEANVMSVSDGAVYSVGGAEENKDGFGHHIIIKTKKNNYIIYAHLKDGSADHLKPTMKKPYVPVNQGTILGKMGNTGRSTGPHLHIEVRSGSFKTKAPRIKPRTSW